LYGSQSSTFANVIEDIWSDEKMSKYIEDNNLLLLEHPASKQVSKSYTCSFDIRSKFFNKYKLLEPFFVDTHKKVKASGFIDSAFGTRLHLPSLTKIGKQSLFHLVSNLLNSSLASSFQAFEAWLIYSAIIDIYNELKERNLKSKLILTIHDSIAFYVHTSEILEVFQICKQCMEKLDYLVPITIGCGIGQVLGFPDKEFENEESIKEYLTKNTF
jgi:DNA polymerase I-like protein with 3'-5' exonuclease and polymerase domains